MAAKKKTAAKKRAARKRPVKAPPLAATPAHVGEVVSSGTGGIVASSWSDQVKELSERVQVRLAGAILEEGGDHFGDAVSVLAHATKAGNSQKTRMRAANLLLTHAHRIASAGLPKPAPQISIDARTQTITAIDLLVQLEAEGGGE